MKPIARAAAPVSFSLLPIRSWSSTRHVLGQQGLQARLAHGDRIMPRGHQDQAPLGAPGRRAGPQAQKGFGGW